MKEMLRTVPRVLVVDDETMNRELLEALLIPEGCEVLQAASGPEALSIVASRRPDLVLLDLRMPGMDGIETCRRIREELRVVLLPIVFVTAAGDRDLRIRGIEAGADDFLTKPVDEVELIVRMRNLLRLKRYHDQREHQRRLIEDDLASMRAQLVRIERLATLGTLASGVGHELNNVATVLESVLLMMGARGATAATSSRYVDELERVRDHIATHATHLLALGRPGPDHAELLDLRVVVEGTLSMLRLSGKIKHIDVRCAVPDDPVYVTVNRTRIEQVLINLIANAADALDEVRGRERSIVVTLEADPVTGRAFCAVEDTGCGIPLDKIEAIFEPYFTTKSPDRGTGLGLPVVKHIVETFGGTLAVDSRPGEGTCFRFDLPAVVEAVGAA